MTIFKRLIRATLIVCICVACAKKQKSSLDDFCTIAYTPTRAAGFEIRSDDRGNTLLRVMQPWQGDEVEEQYLALFNDEQSAVGYEGEYIVGTAKRIVCMSTSHIAMLDAIGLSDRIVGVSGKQYVMNEVVAHSEEVKDIGYDSNINYELLLALRPDIVLMYGVSAENSSVTAKLRSLDIPYIYLGDYTELSPLGKAEWVVAVAEIAGCREQGIAYFEGVVSRYNEVRASMDDSANRPQVMLNTPYQDVWYMPSDDSYMVQLIEDAGGAYIYKGKNTSAGSVGISLEEAYRLVSTADIWLNVGQCRTMSDLRATAPQFIETDVVRHGMIYNNNRRQTASGGSDFWESAIVHPDVVLRDMAAIMRGDDDSLYYHRRLK